MSKTVAKNRRRLKRSVRKTLGAILLATAVFVAAIPVDDLRAAGTVSMPKKVSVDIHNCRIPIVEPDETIYTTGDGAFQFAYVLPNDTSESNKVAVILGYSSGRLNAGTLEIPNAVDAYLKYSENLGTAYGYCAVGKQKNFLYFRKSIDKTDENGDIIYVDDLDKPLFEDDGVTPKLDPVTGLPMYEKKPDKEVIFKPCLYEDYDQWKDLEINQFYYNRNQNSVSGGSGSAEPSYALTLDSSVQRIQNATVKYIGNQTLIAGTGNDAGTWTVGPEITTPEQGIFRGEKAGNVSSLIVGKDMSGIGDYAFYGCINLQSIKLENGLDTIGNYAFANCRNIQSIDLDIGSMISVIGDHAFYNCQSLKTFVMPKQVTKIGDSAFEKCIELTNVDLCGNNSKVSLEQLGYDVFKGCVSLESITFPESLEENVDISMFEGCESLKYIAVKNNQINLVEGEGLNNSFGFDEFKATVPEAFYVEGVPQSDLHQTCTEHMIAFKYINKGTSPDVYEITITNRDGLSAVYQVNSSNELVKCEIPAGMKEVVLPSTIGPYQITSIWSTSFQNNCSIEKISIPSSIINIDANAFRGCHNLKTVIFEEPVNLKSIGTGAFQTQEVLSHNSSCTDTNLPTVPELRFVGPISQNAVPFQYAMNPENYFNNREQRKTYISYHSSWPTNLVVRYNDATDKNELISYPTFASFKEIYDLGDPNLFTSAQIESLVNEYPSMTSMNALTYAKAVRGALDKNTPALKDTMTMYEEDIINAALNLELPEGIESVKSGIFVNGEVDDNLMDMKKTLTAYGLERVEKEAFKGFENLSEVYLLNNTEVIGDYAFEGCKKLEKVYLPDSVNYLGLRPFTGCTKLVNVNFGTNPKYECLNSVIYEKDMVGERFKIVEFLEGRVDGFIEPEEFEGISEIANEAFAGENVKVSSVDLTKTEIVEIPAKAFMDTKRLSNIYLPETWERIGDSAFANSSLLFAQIPGNSGYISDNAFDNHDAALKFYCPDKSYAAQYALAHNIRLSDKALPEKYRVRFWNYDNTMIGEEQMVEAGSNAIPPEEDSFPWKPGEVFTGWSPDYHGIQSNMEITAQYSKEVKYYTVTFMDHDGTLLGTDTKEVGGRFVEPPVIPPTRSDGWTFAGWKPALESIQSDTTVVAQYNPPETNTPDDGDNNTGGDNNGGNNNTGGDNNGGNNNTGGDNNGGNNNTGGDNNGGNNNTGGDNNGGNNTGNNNDGNNNNNNNNNPSPKLYTLTVVDGSGSGSYVEGANVFIYANQNDKLEFVKWTVDPADVTMVSKTMNGTILIMPAKNVTVTANFKAKDTNNGGSNNGGSNNGGSNNGGSNNGGSSSGGSTTVVIDKNGLSNSGVTNVVINGSSDNFKMKISENANATEKIVRALMAEYGSLDTIKYFPMDITLYDAAGKNQITDTTGLSIRITLPLPDSLRQYAGNNKAAAVSSNGKLEKLNVKFTTINEVPCITFQAEHFSPYVIYVDTSNLNAGVIKDETPKTGDGIHPKWFLSLGLFCASLVLFLKKDKRSVKVRARA